MEKEPKAGYGGDPKEVGHGAEKQKPSATRLDFLILSSGKILKLLPTPPSHTEVETSLEVVT